MPKHLIGTTELADLLGRTHSQANNIAKGIQQTMLVGNSYVIPLPDVVNQIVKHLQANQEQLGRLTLAMCQLEEGETDATYTAAEFGRLIGISRQRATLLVQREFSAEADGGNYAIPLADVRAYIERKIAQHEARIAHLQGSLAKLQETAPTPQELPTAE